ncbi:hypothetical protein Salmuc_00082 [Salipiger mucosus DSM 16094]|uniref:HTH araC/xylS-type domain-containing protein n=1 Tax=Salipiger mucosus DSM 16094 TaxID=1123237 RepID=S9RNR5_9RHOB|nr:hypothetical protein Salmuc_00082 [Salipiger mucosus DSM 16094]
MEMSWRGNPDLDGSGVSWSLSSFRTSGPDTVEVQSTRDPSFVFTQVPLHGGFAAELSCGHHYDARAPGLVRPRISGALYQFEAPDNEIFGTLATLETIEGWFGDQVPPALRPLLDGVGNETYHSPRALPDYLRRTLLAALGSSSPLGPRLVSNAAQLILAFHLEQMCIDDKPRVTPLADRLARDAHALLSARPEDPPSLAEIAAEVGVSARRLGEAYRIEFGCSYNAALQQVRLEAICAALREGMPIKVVAHRFGYSSVSNFSSAFRRRTGLPPRKWLEHQAARRH